MQFINVKNYVYNEADDIYRVQVLNPILYQTLKKEEEMNFSVCMFTISGDYIQASIQDADIIYVAIDAQNKIAGFVCLEHQYEHNEQNNLYLSLLCSCQPGVGAVLLTKYVIPVAKKMEVNGIILHAVAHKISYYKKYGFKIGQTCYGYDFSELTEEFKKKFNSTDDMYEDPVVFNLFRTLSRLDLLVNSDTEDCRKEKFLLDPTMTKAARLGCLSNGVFMYLCLRRNIYLPPLTQPVLEEKEARGAQRNTPRLKRHSKINRPTMPTRLVTH